MKINNLAIAASIILSYFLLARKKDNETPSFNDKNLYRLMPPKTPNFTIEEFNSKDGTPMPPIYYGNVQRVMEQLEILRKFLNSSAITINSGFRSPAHNLKVGGVPNSLHTKGMAADFTVKGYSAKQVQEALESLIKNNKIQDGGVGSYSSFTHYDIGKPRRWNG